MEALPKTQSVNIVNAPQACCQHKKTQQVMCQAASGGSSHIICCCVPQETQTRRADLAATWAANRRTKALKQALVAWDEYTKRQTVQHREIGEIIEAKRRRTTLHTVFSAWRAHAQVQSVLLPVPLAPRAIAGLVLAPCELQIETCLCQNNCQPQSINGKMPKTQSVNIVNAPKACCQHKITQQVMRRTSHGGSSHVICCCVPQEMQTRRADLAATWAANRRTKVLKQAVLLWSGYTKCQTLKRQQIRKIIETKRRRRTTLSSVFQAWHAETQVQTAVIANAVTPHRACACFLGLHICPKLSPSSYIPPVSILCIGGLYQ